ncbi:DUF2589 domain-containing protein [Kineosporia sp. J2-2]|uniref:DUF2589 domain-containing protein n=1 Tax=Kineosporia corallincola TaxID=2835133 RepID=A0ABS5TTJ2_9ACTN|nr:DUF2589 domain-containing protein [Kineosporia corallincola]MBT0774131.1 DUF2589 domain-containing protein [Kineosporia corallincola]
MPDIPAELNSLDFGTLIGGPLMAVVQAQSVAAKNTVDFINSVGFTSTTDTSNNPITVPRTTTFTFERPVHIPDPNPANTPQGGTAPVISTTEKVTLSVPFLTMVPIPYIRIEETTVDFNAKITSLQASTSSNQTNMSANLNAKFGWGPVSASLNASVSNQSQSSSQDRTTRTYSMAVHVRAVQAEVPGGTERILNLLEESITAK